MWRTDHRHADDQWHLIHWDLKKMNGNATPTTTSFPPTPEDFPLGRWSFLGLGSELSIPPCLSAHGLRALSHFPLFHSFTSSAHALRLKTFESFHPISIHGHLSVSPRFDSPYFLHFVTSLIFFLQFLKFVVNLHTPPNRCMDSTAEFSSPHSGYEPKAHDFYETSVEPYIQLLDSPPLFSSKFSSADPDYDDAALEDMFHQSHRAQACRSLREDLSVSQSSSSMSDRMVVRPVGDRLGQHGEHRISEAQGRTLLDKQKEQILEECHARSNQHEFEAARGEEDQRLPQGQVLQRDLEFSGARRGSLTEMEELRKFQNSTLDTVARWKWIRTLCWHFLPELRNCKMKQLVWTIQKSFRMLTQFAVEIPVTSEPVSFPPHPIHEGMLRHSFVTPSRREGSAKHLGHMVYRETFFADPDASTSAPCPQDLHQWNSSIEEPLHSSTVEKCERPEQNQDLRCQYGPSAKDSVIFSGVDSSKNYGAHQRLKISDLHFDKFPTTTTFACWKIRFKTEICTCSHFPTEAMQWIREVEMVDSVDDFLKIFVFCKRNLIPLVLVSSPNVDDRTGQYDVFQCQNFEVLDARIASALNKIIHNSHFESRISLEELRGQETGPFLSRRTDCLLGLRLLPGHWEPWFCRKLHRPVHHCSSKWQYSGIRF